MLSSQNRLRIDNEASQFVFSWWRGHRATETLVQVTIASSRHQVNTLDEALVRLAEKILLQFLRSLCPMQTEVRRVLK
jgi:hypothetical protein